MYCPATFRENRAEVLHQTICSYPLASLITIGTQGLGVSQLPLLHLPAAEGPGILRGHLARANSQWKEYTPGSEALAIFTGVQHYVTPNWYPSKQKEGKVVPTWNYVTVHARGVLTFTSDPDWLLDLVTRLTDAMEGSGPEAWRVSDAPRDYIESQLRSIVGVEMAIASLEGKWKLSQNRVPQDYAGVVSGLEQLGSTDARTMASLMKSESPA